MHRSIYREANLALTCQFLQENVSQGATLAPWDAFPCKFGVQSVVMILQWICKIS